MQRLHLALRAAGIESTVLSAKPSSASRPPEHVLQFKRTLLERGVDRGLREASRFLGLSQAPDLSGHRLIQHPAYQAADILHIHSFFVFFSYLWLPRLTRHKPAILTLCDMWPYTGHCQYSYDCDRWKTGCGHCPYPDGYPAIQRDGTALEWKLKQWAFQRSNLVVVTKSRWATEQVQQSMLSHFPHHRIYNGVDTQIFYPRDRQSCRQSLGLPLDRNILLFSASNLNNPRKGGDLLLQAIRELPQSVTANLLLLTLGHGGESLAQAVGIETVNLGYISDEQRLAHCYAAADLFLFPTRNELLGNVALESLACGTPVVAFKVGGVPDVVQHGLTGYLAEPENASDLCRGIQQLLTQPQLHQNMSRNGPERVKQDFSLEVAVQKYTNLYHSLLAQAELGQNTLLPV